MASEERTPDFEARRVSDIMIPLAEYPHLPVWATLRDAMAKVEQTQLHVRGRQSLPRALLIFDLDGSLVGTVRRRDIMRGLEPKFLLAQPLEYRKKLFDVAVDPNLAELSYDRVVKGIREQVERPVSEVMKPIRQTIDAEAHVITAVYEMVTNSLTLLPVLDKGKVVGVIRSVDVFHALARLVLSP